MQSLLDLLSIFPFYQVLPQGPEWVWCMGFYLRAKLLLFLKQRKQRSPEGGIEGVDCTDEEITQFYATVLTFHRAMISSEPYRGYFFL